MNVGLISRLISLYGVDSGLSLSCLQCPGEKKKKAASGSFFNEMLPSGGSLCFRQVFGAVWAKNVDQVWVLKIEGT